MDDMAVNNSQITCMKCNNALENMKTEFTYLGHKFNAVLLRCPVCGQVYIPEALVKGRINEVERTLEDK